MRSCCFLQQLRMHSKAGTQWMSLNEGRTQSGEQARRCPSFPQHDAAQIRWSCSSYPAPLRCPVSLEDAGRSQSQAEPCTSLLPMCWDKILDTHTPYRRKVSVQDQLAARHKHGRRAEESCPSYGSQKAGRGRGAHPRLQPSDPLIWVPSHELMCGLVP